MEFSNKDLEVIEYTYNPFDNEEEFEDFANAKCYDHFKGGNEEQTVVFVEKDYFISISFQEKNNTLFIPYIVDIIRVTKKGNSFYSYPCSPLTYFKLVQHKKLELKDPEYSVGKMYKKIEEEFSQGKHLGYYLINHINQTVCIFPDDWIMMTTMLHKAKVRKEDEEFPIKYHPNVLAKVRELQ